ncbi:hypothetical protein [Streptomyces sp. HNM0574]|uniref:hypothetical protein n=1 Tax=Streptomyces sp. HNM0574 TaxID=2714954 RepID=UPI00146EA3E7|nr:hypothetical protein [Streptomyces sp. HNM0574]NLU70363.1 hypothetical protein [Streptomyces sp. HNM0574]
MSANPTNVTRRRKHVPALASLATTAALTLGTLAAAGPAQAAAPASDARAGASAAMCVKTTAENKAHGYKVTVRNKCGKKVKVKIIMSYAKDSRCFGLNKGQTRYRETGGLGVWKKTVFC